MGKYVAYTVCHGIGDSHLVDDPLFFIYVCFFRRLLFLMLILVCDDMGGSINVGIQKRLLHGKSPARKWARRGDTAR